jgi:uncharacterized RDD family membrane protein YckC
LPIISPRSESLEPRPAGLLRRLGAMIYDALLVLAVWMFTLFPMVAVVNDMVYGPVVRSVLFLEMYAFFAYFWIYRGQTLGMLAWRLQVVSDYGARLTLTQATLRFVGAVASFVTLGLGYLWMYLDRERRTWPDRLSASQVLVIPKQPR